MFNRSADESNKPMKSGATLIEDESFEVGGVKWAVYGYYAISVGVNMCVLSFVMYVAYQVI